MHTDTHGLVTCVDTGLLSFSVLLRRHCPHPVRRPGTGAPSSAGLRLRNLVRTQIAGVEVCSDRVQSAVNRGQQKPADGGSRKSVDSSNAGMEDEVQVLLEQSRILAQVAQLEMDRTRLVVEAHGKDCPMQEKILGETIVARANPAHFEWSILSSDADDVPISPHMVEAKLYNQKPRSRRGSALRAGWVAMIQGPACVKERESKIAKIQNQCRCVCLLLQYLL